MCLQISALNGLGLWYLMPLSTIFQLYCDTQFLLVEETAVPGENHLPVASHWQTLSHKVVSVLLAGFEFVLIGTDCTGSYKSNYHTTKATMTPSPEWYLNNSLMFTEWPFNFYRGAMFFFLFLSPIIL